MNPDMKKKFAIRIVDSQIRHEIKYPQEEFISWQDQMFQIEYTLAILRCGRLKTAAMVLNTTEASIIPKHCTSRS